MIVVGVMLLVSVLAGGMTGLAVWHWPRFDPAAPKLSAETVRKEVRGHRSLRGFIRSRLDPGQATGLLLTVALSAVLAGIVGVGLLILMIDHHTGLARYDLSAARWGATNATSTSTNVLRWVSQLGGTPAMIAVPLLVIATQRKRAPLKALFALFLTTVLGQVFIVNVTKAVVDRPRPNIHQLTGFSGASFPSGHAAASAAMFAAAALVLGRGRGEAARAWLAGGAVAIAAGVATTRVFLGVHWLTDVIAGVAIGWSWFALCSIAFGGRLLRFGRPAEIAQADTVAETGPLPSRSSELTPLVSRSGEGGASTDARLDR